MEERNEGERWRGNESERKWREREREFVCVCVRERTVLDWEYPLKKNI